MLNFRKSDIIGDSTYDSKKYFSRMRTQMVFVNASGVRPAAYLNEEDCDR